MKQMHSGMYMLMWWFTELNVTAHVFRAYNYAFILIFARQRHRATVYAVLAQGVYTSSLTNFQEISSIFLNFRRIFTWQATQ